MEVIKAQLKWVIVCTAFLFVGIIIQSSALNIYPFYGLSTFYFLILAVLMIRHYYERLAGYGISRKYILFSLFCILMLIYLRGVKYNFFYDNDKVRRHLWYAYYIPLLLLPYSLFYAALTIENDRMPQRDGWIRTLISIITFVLIIGILTNDFHECVFRFQDGFKNWDAEYEHGIVFYLIVLWEYLFYILFIRTIWKNNKLGSRKSTLFVCLIPITLSFLLLILLFSHLLQRNGYDLIGFMEIKCYMAVAILGCLIEAGMIPYKDDPEQLMKISSLELQISDKEGKNVYISDTAKENNTFEVPLYAEDSELVPKDKITRLYDLGNGQGIWKEDVSRINSLNTQLSEKQEQLMEENELVRLENELEEKKRRLEERDRIYDQISERTKRVSDKIYEHTKLAEEITDMALISELGQKVCFFGIYIKRFSNLYLFAAKNEYVEIKELSLAIQELLICLNEMHIPGEFYNDVESDIDVETALSVYEFIEELLEDNLPVLKGVYIRIIREGSIFLKISLEGEEVNASAFNEQIHAGILQDASCLYEDGITYMRIPLCAEEVKYDEPS